MEDLEERRRSVSRGREAFRSTGRGGAGNIQPSPSVEGNPSTDNFSPNRGRELDVDPDRAKSSGRGGIGNIRSRSRTRAASQVPDGYPQTASLVSENAANTAAYERQVIDEANKNSTVHSSGRGGAGNMTGSRSRSRGPHRLFGGDANAKLHSTGRGGAGNIQSGDTDTLDSRDEAGLYGPFHEEGVHSTGRGGLANLTGIHSPPPELPAHQAQVYETSGRGGAGNIRSRSQSRESPRSGSRDRITRIWHKVSHPHGRGIEEESANPIAVDGDGQNHE